MNTENIIFLIIILAVANSKGIIGRIIQFGSIFYFFKMIAYFIDTWNWLYLLANIIFFTVLFLPYTLKYGLPILKNVLVMIYSLIKKVVNTIGNTYKNRGQETEIYEKPENNNPYRNTKDPSKKLLEATFDYWYFKQIQKDQQRRYIG
jgi:hypothetical protein